MATFSRWLAPAVLAAGLGFGALVPATAHAQDDSISRVIVDVADVVLRGGQPYYRNGDYGQDDRLVMQRDRYGRPVYYRVVQQRPPYGNAYGYYNNRYDNRYDDRHAQPAQRVSCNRNGNCTVKYYDPRYDRRGYQSSYGSGYYGSGYRQPVRYWDGYRWRTR
jgi:hypothetical protein